MLNAAAAFMRNALGLAAPADTPASADPISARMYEATRDIHTEAEQHPFVRELQAQTLPATAFLQYLADLHLVYARLEDLLLPSHAVDPALMPESLRRTAGLAADMAAFDGALTPPSSAALTYAAHLDALAQEDPALLLAHAYVRYMGDLSGGLAIKAWARKQFGVDLAFGDFSQFKSEGQSKETWKACLNATALSTHQQARMLEEAALTFSFTAQIMTASIEAAQDAQAYASLDKQLDR